MVSFVKSSIGRLALFAFALFIALFAFAPTADACQQRSKCHRKHRLANFIGRLLLVLMCCGIAFASAAPALAGFGHHAVVQQQVVVQKVRVQQVRVRQVRQRVVVQQVVAQPVYAQPIVAQQFYAQPLVQQQAFYAQPLVQQLVQPNCGGGGGSLQLRQNFSGGGCSSFFAR